MPHPYGAQNLVILEPEGISEIIPPQPSVADVATTICRGLHA